MTGLLLAGTAGTMIVAPHLLSLETASPRSAAAIWLLAMCLRALIVVYAGVYLIFLLPATDLFQLVTHWCWHTAVPLLTNHVGLSGHSVGDVALLAPIIGLTVSILSVCLGLYRAARSVSTWVHRTSIGPGPQRSLIVGEHDVVVAAAGLRQPRVIVSAGALTAFDDEELAASLAHEHGHIAGRHRFVLVFAEVCRALARFLPGTRRATSELIFHLERDADRWALARRHDPSALASAICKAAVCRRSESVALMTLGGGGGVTRRVRELLASPAALSATRQRGLDALATGMAVAVVCLAVALPPAAVASFDQATAAQAVRHCPT